MNLQQMPTWQLVENYRSLVGGAAKARRAEDKTRLGKQADAHEEEILRRMA